WRPSRRGAAASGPPGSAPAGRGAVSPSARARAGRGPRARRASGPRAGENRASQGRLLQLFEDLLEARRIGGCDLGRLALRAKIRDLLRDRSRSWATLVALARHRFRRIGRREDLSREALIDLPGDIERNLAERDAQVRALAHQRAGQLVRG